jgi:hypothetical protein
MARTFVEGMKETKDRKSHLTWMLWSSSMAIVATVVREGSVRFKELFHNYAPLKKKDLIQLLDKLEDVIATDLDDVVKTSPTQQ